MKYNKDFAIPSDAVTMYIRDLVADAIEGGYLQPVLSALLVSKLVDIPLGLQAGYINNIEHDIFAGNYDAALTMANLMTLDKLQSFTDFVHLLCAVVDDERNPGQSDDGEEIISEFATTFTDTMTNTALSFHIIDAVQQIVMNNSTVATEVSVLMTRDNIVDLFHNADFSTHAQNRQIARDILTELINAQLSL